MLDYSACTTSSTSTTRRLAPQAQLLSRERLVELVKLVKLVELVVLVVLVELAELEEQSKNKKSLT